MTVKKLIKELTKYPPGTKVKVEETTKYWDILGLDFESGKRFWHDEILIDRRVR